MTVANTLAYYFTATITAIKSVIVQAPGRGVNEGSFCFFKFIFSNASSSHRSSIIDLFL
jgi:hypothetical protein